MDQFSDTVNAVELLQSMYYGDDEFAFKSDDDQHTFERLRKIIDDGAIANALPDSVHLDIRIPLTIPDEQENPLKLALVCQLFVQRPEFRLAIASAANTWLTRDAHQSLTRMLQDYQYDTEDRSSQILEGIQYIQAEAETVAIEALQQQKEQAIAKAKAKENGPVRFMREWIWFPMIYTREKRGHIIDWAPGYSITGFLCPGKPGALCLEGPEKNVATFINDIKTKSWADIPASHRKMTSKWQERVDCQSVEDMDRLRKFQGMVEVTFDLHGAFGNHNDLNQLQQWLKERGCDEAFDHLFDHDVK